MKVKSYKATGRRLFLIANLKITTILLARKMKDILENRLSSTYHRKNINLFIFQWNLPRSLPQFNGKETVE